MTPCVPPIQATGAKVWFNTLVPVPSSVPSSAPGQQFKYGVMAVEELVHELANWRSLYISGRMHKPVCRT